MSRRWGEPADLYTDCRVGQRGCRAAIDNVCRTGGGRKPAVGDTRVRVRDGGDLSFPRWKSTAREDPISGVVGLGGEQVICFEDIVIGECMTSSAIVVDRDVAVTRNVLQRFSLLQVTDVLLEAAGDLSGRSLRSLDAIHIA